MIRGFNRYAMRNRNTSKKHSQRRQLLVREAARLMYEENVGQYYDAKRMAAKRLRGRVRRGASGMRVQVLPSNAEIAEELAALARFHEGDCLNSRLFAMRLTALDIMQQLQDFQPRLIGSVSTGRIRKGSDIDLHVFTDNVEELIEHLRLLRWDFERGEITIKQNGKLRNYTHLYLNHLFPVELSVYPVKEMRIRTRSSTDGKPIVRIKEKTLVEILLKEHEHEWRHYLETGEIAGSPFDPLGTVLE